MGCCHAKRPEPSELILQNIEKDVYNDNGDDPNIRAQVAERRQELEALNLAVEEGRLPLSTPTFGQAFRFEAEEEHTIGQVA